MYRIIYMCSIIIPNIYTITKIKKNINYLLANSKLFYLDSIS